jgi:hypothetical protein
MPKKINLTDQTGAMPVVILLAITGIILYLVIATFLPLKDTILNKLFPKNTSEAASKLVAATNFDSTFPTNELLVKFKSTSKAKVKENKDDTGIESVTTKFKKDKVSKLERVAKEGKKSSASAEVYSWYKVSLNNKGEIVKGQFNKKSKKLETKTQETASVKLCKISCQIYSLIQMLKQLNQTIPSLPPS